MHTISPQNAGRSRVCARVYVYIVTFPVFLGVCLFAYLHICASVHQRAQNEQIFPPVCAPVNQHFCPPAGANGHVRRTRAQNCAIFFFTTQRTGIQRVTSVSREIPENFSKISSPKIWCVCQKSVPLHSQNRNEAYNASQIWSNSIFENIT